MRARYLAGGPFDLLGQPAYRLVWLNCLLLQIGFHLAFTAQGVVAFDITGNNSAVGFVAFAQGAGLLLATPFAGVLADRFAKRLLFSAELMLGLTALALSVLIYTGAVTIVFVAASGFLLGVGLAAFWPSITTSMVKATQPAERPTGAGLFQVAVQLTRTGAPFLAAGLLSIKGVGGGGAYLVVAFVYVPVLITAALAPAAKTPADGGTEVRASIWREIKLGLRYVASNRQLLQDLLSFMIVIPLGFSIIVVLPAFTREVLDAGKSGFGILFGFNAIGAFFASLLTAALGSSSKAPWLLVALGVGLGLSIALTGLAPSFSLALAGMFVAGLFGGGFQTLIVARMLHLTEPAYFGRLTALTSVGWSLTNLLGLIVGSSADLAGERAVLVSVGLILATALLLLSLLFRAQNRTGSGREIRSAQTASPS